MQPTWHFIWASINWWWTCQVESTFLLINWNNWSSQWLVKVWDCKLWSIDPIRYSLIHVPGTRLSLHSLRQEDNVDIAEIWIKCSQDSGDYKFNTAQSHVPRLLCHCSTQQEYFSHCCWGSTKIVIMKNLLPHITGLCLQNNNSLFFQYFLEKL